MPGGTGSRASPPASAPGPRAPPVGLGDPGAVALDDPARVDVLADDDERWRGVGHGGGPSVESVWAQAAIGTNWQPSTNSSKKSCSVSSSTCSIRPTSASSASRRGSTAAAARAPCSAALPTRLDPLRRDRREQADGDGVLDVDRRWRSRRRGRPGRPGRRSRPGGAGGCAGRRRWRPWPGRAGWRRSARSVMPCSGATMNSSRPSRKRPSGVHPARARRSSARMSTRPEPQMPDRLASPIVSNANAVAVEAARVSMAPSAPGMPKRSRPPSNAGPAGHDAARMRVAVGDDDLGVRADVDEHPDAAARRRSRPRRGRRRCPRRRGWR